MMTPLRVSLTLAASALLAAASAPAQTPADAAHSRVMTATLPIPLPDKTDHPLPPDRLRAESPWTLSLAGEWRFSLTRGEIKDGHFAMSSAEIVGLRVSSQENGNPVANAFDNDTGSRWCASNGDFPQWLQVKLGDAHSVTGVDLAWEYPNDHHTCRVEGGDDGIHWHTLLDLSAEPGIGDGLLTLPASGAPVRYVRLFILDVSDGHWASLREMRIHYRNGGQDVVWHPGTPTGAAPPHADDFVATGFADGGWDKVIVPSNWEMAGYSIPTYNTVDDSVGLYRRWMDVPAAWAGRRIIWHFDGAFNGAEIYVNGQRAGYHESGYTAFDVDLTGLVKPGERNLFAARLCKSTPSEECETGDYQCLGGLYRDTRLIAVPPTHVADVTVRTPLSPNYHDATLQVSVEVNGTAGENVDVTGYVTDAADGSRLPATLTGNGVVGPDGRATLALSTAVSGPKLWSAEKPSLYYVTLDLQRAGQPVERVEQRFGFRQIDIKNNIVLWNGQPIKCNGICRHDFWADKGFALTDAEWTKDLTQMKWTNINAIRTSHYNHAARFLELCEERGFYILDEVPFCWIDEKVKDPAFAPPLIQRATETLARDKNRPCVLAWSLGNENPTGVNTQTLHDLVTRLDPTRPSFASGAGPDSVKGQVLFDTHYPSPDSIKDYIKKNSGIAPEVITEHPHTFYARESQIYDPGCSDGWSEGLMETWDLLWKSPTILGSFIWEWQCQGIADKFPDHTTGFGDWGLDHMRQENNKGIMDAYRNPKAEQWIVKMVYSPVQFPSRTLRVDEAGCTFGLLNHYAFTDLGELTFRWTALRGNAVLGRGDAHLACAPGQSTDVKLPTPAGLTALQLEVNRADGTNVTYAKLEAPDAKPIPAPPASANRSPLSVRDGADAVEVVSAAQRVVFDKRSGAIRNWVVGGRDRLGKGGSYLNLGEAKTAKGDHYYRAKQPPVTDNAVLSAQTATDGSVHVNSRSEVRSGGDSQETLGKLTVDYVIQPDAEMSISYKLDWTADDMNLWEYALCLPVAVGEDRQSWSRDSYFTAYPEGHLGAPTGTCGPKDVAFRSSKRSLHFLTLTDAAGSGLALIAKGGVPLIGRATTTGAGTTLIASREIAAAGPDDLSRQWFHQHDIHATKDKPLSGEFVLRALGAP